MEECLLEIQDRQQLIALQFYLKDFFQKVSGGYYNYNHYKVLKDKILKSKATACVVNFNYDTLFENSIGGSKWEEIDHYIRGNIKVVKVHGSCNWSYVLKKDVEDDNRYGISDSYEYLKEYPATVLQNMYHDKRIAQSSSTSSIHQFPVIAIPTFNTKQFFCPDHHISELKVAMHQIDRVLIIGWKAGDIHLIKMMEDNITQPVAIAVVGGSRAGIKEVRDKLSNIKNATFSMEVVGFSNFIKSKECTTFFGV